MFSEDVVGLVKEIVTTLRTEFNNSYTAEMFSSYLVCRIRQGVLRRLYE